MTQAVVRPSRSDDAQTLVPMARRLLVGVLPWRDDTAALAAIEESLAEAVDRATDSSSAAFVAEAGGEVVGVVTVSRERHFTGSTEAVIRDLFVFEAAEGRGVAKALLAEAEEWAVKIGAESLMVETSARNDRAVRLYHAAGFVDEDLRLSKPLSSER